MTGAVVDMLITFTADLQVKEAIASAQDEAQKFDEENYLRTCSHKYDNDGSHII